VCRRCYIHPAIVDTFLDGRAIDEAARPRTIVKGLNADETAVLMLLGRLKGRRSSRAVHRAAA
jgi:DNA topoisomerase IB